MFKIWLELAFLVRATAQARLAWNELGSNKLELIRFFDSSNPQILLYHKRDHDLRDIFEYIKQFFKKN